MKKVTIYTDGGSKGNPGPASIGVVIKYNGKEREYSKAIGETTNNVAEYEAVIYAFKKLKHLIPIKERSGTHVAFYSDSELLVSQISARYKVKSEELIPRFVSVWNAMQDFGEVSFTFVPREKNEAADKLVNKALL